MTAAEALSSIREDIDRLEARDLVKPGHIRRRRAEVDAIARELAMLRDELAAAMARIASNAKAQREADLRIGMLANVMLMIGIDPIPHLRRPTTEAETYNMAARFVLALRRQHRHRWPNYTRAEQMELVQGALITARLHRLSDVPIETLADAIEGQAAA